MTIDGSSLVRKESAGRAPGRAVDRFLDHLVEPELASARRRAPRRARARRARRRASSSTPARPGRPRAALPAPPASSVPGSASSPTFARSVAIGVRSSCEASATSCRWVRSDASRLASSSSRRVERRLISSRPRWPVRSLRSPVSTIRSVVSVSRRSGATARPETSAPRIAAAPTPPSEMKTSSHRRCARFRSTSSSEREIVTTWFRATSVSTRVGTP